MNKIKELNNITTRMVYAFYIDNESKSLNDHISYKIHLKCLEFILYERNHAEYFNEIYFIIHTLDLNNPLIDDLKQKLTTITNKCKHVYFIIEKNIPEYREGIIFKKYILDKLNDYDGLTLFFHNKGFHSRYKDDFPTYWVTSQYFFNMFFENFYQYFELFLYNDNKLIFGFPFLFRSTDIINNGYYISGSCYWMKCKEIYKYLNKNDFKINNYNTNIAFSYYSCAETFFPHVLNIDQFDYPQSDVLKNTPSRYIGYFDIATINENIKKYYEYTFTYLMGKLFFPFHDYIIENIENYNI